MRNLKQKKEKRHPRYKRGREGNNISVEICITYNMYQWWNGNASPETPFVYTIKFK